MFDKPLQFSTEPPIFNACVTVNDVTIARKGNTLWAAQNTAACAMINHLNGKPVDFGYETNNQVMDMSDPITRLHYL